MISVVTPVLNAECRIARTLSAMQSQSAEFEHIVQDGGSTDSTLKIVHDPGWSFRRRVTSERDQGLYDAICRGFAHAQGEILAWINAGDVYPPWALATVAEIFRQYPDVQWLTGIPAVFVDSPSTLWMLPYTPIYPSSFIRWGLYREGRLGSLQQESMFWRRELWERARGEEVLRKYRLAGDYHLWRAFAGHARLYSTSTMLGSFGFTDGQLSASFRPQYLRECGIASGVAPSRARGAGLVNRATSQILRHRVLAPRVVDGKWEWRKLR